MEVALVVGMTQLLGLGTGSYELAHFLKFAAFLIWVLFSPEQYSRMYIFAIEVSTHAQTSTSYLVSFISSSVITCG